MDAQTRLELEAAAFRSLVGHLRERTDVQNIDLMNLSGFCRNCLSRWYQEAANEKGIDMDKDAARELVYGMPFGEWRDKYQTEATPEQKSQFAEANEIHGWDGTDSLPDRFVTTCFHTVSEVLEAITPRTRTDERRIELARQSLKERQVGESR